jgi:hypothetical protein
MSIIITGLEMPRERESFTLTIKYNGMVLDTETGIQVAEAHELPPHGDLIDYDFCMENYELLHDDDGHPVYAVRMRDINNAPTIIPAEEGEA